LEQIPKLEQIWPTDRQIPSSQQLGDEQTPQLPALLGFSRHGQCIRNGRNRR
jgi:hypothetical protein